ncbi:MULTISPECIES: hypothetical protein [Bacillus]|uniref:hypothetical protein n=1 Tax=Bacillus TaxID=1386 RepID=UPI0004172025|nr:MULTISPECIES: hypothetical protein [Bacillus]WFA05792.1 hypothetical protein P3X63_02785 [Bacillus sp. HSf4]
MKSANPYLFIENCKEALSFYQETLGGDIQNVLLADDIEMFKGDEGKLSARRTSSRKQHHPFF